MMDKDKFTDNLVGELIPVQPLLKPSQRFLIWALGLTLLSVGGMWLLQEFRPGAVSQLMSLSFFGLGMVSGILAILLGGYALFCEVVPGKVLSKPIRFGVYLFPLISVSAFILDSINPSFTPGVAGGRHYCVQEVFVYGITGVVWTYFMLKKGYLRPQTKVVYGMVLFSGLIPSLAMQLACAYMPMHALKFHLGPVLIIMLGVGLIHFIRDHLDKSSEPSH